MAIPDCGNRAPAKRVPRGEVQRFFRDVVMKYEGDECLQWPFSTNHGYGQIRRNGQPQLASRLVCEEIYGPAPSLKHHAAHSCGRGKHGCVTKRHLSWKTPEENEADKINHGTSPRGENCGSAKLTEAQVRDIISLKGTMSQSELGAMFGVTRRTVGRIHARNIWSWLSI